MEVYNIYCDESCHLENDGQKAMVLGAVWCRKEQTRELSQRIRECKIKHGLKPDFEIKWTKISPGKSEFYFDLLQLFLNEELYFRAVVIPEKSVLRHEDFDQSHDTWYYKMYFVLLKHIFTLNPDDQFNIYIDIKDTRGGQKAKKLQEVIQNSLYDHSGDKVKRLQILESKHVEQMQIADLLIGSLSYLHNDRHGSAVKRALSERFKTLARYFCCSTPYMNRKINILVWSSSKNQ